ncbi:MAG: DedA family protein [Nitrospirae bacterium]|nr:DedA family protein [Nitrospirota bacterium]
MTHISGIIGHFPYIGLFILLILGGIGLPFPEDATLILCGFLISTKVVAPLPALLISYSGLLIADFFLYLIGKKYGRRIVTHKRFHHILSPERLSLLEEKFNRKGILIILFGRHLIGLRVNIFLVAGVMRMPPLKFVTVDALSSTFTMALMVGAGYIGSESLQVIRKDITRIEHIGILLVIIVLLSYLIFANRRFDS